MGPITYATNNWWGTTDENEVSGMIHDYYDDVALPEVLYQPIAMQAFDISGQSFNTPPTADSGSDQIVFDEITLDGSQSNDPNGEIVSYQWQLIHRENSDYNRTATGVTPKVLDLKNFCW